MPSSPWLRKFLRPFLALFNRGVGRREGPQDLLREFEDMMDEGEQDESAWWKDVPEGSVPVHGIWVVAYINEKGKEMYIVNTKGSTALSTSLGLLELAKLKLANYVEGK